MADFRLSASAETDIVNVLAWSEETFGEIIRQRYEELLITGLRDIASDPERAGSLSRPELGEAVRSYHLRHSRERARMLHGFVRRPRHLLLYRAIAPGLIGIGRVLHDAMELEREEYSRLKARDKTSMATEDLPEWLVEQIAASEMDAKYDHLDQGD